MNGATLMNAMTVPGYGAPMSSIRYSELAGACSTALIQAGCTTVSRAAMFLAQIGEESGSLRWTEELADGSEYDWRRDLGNTEPGDGPRFKGRSFIQVTGRSHYANLSRWAHGKNYVPTSTFFLDNPSLLAQDRYAFLGAVWYWTVARPQMNALADAHDITGATWAVNGGLNNFAERDARWRHCLTLGNGILPTPPAPPKLKEFTLDASAAKKFQEVEHKLDTLIGYFLGSDGHHHSVESAVAHVTQGAMWVSKRGTRWPRLFRKIDADAAAKTQNTRLSGITRQLNTVQSHEAAEAKAAQAATTHTTPSKVSS